MSDHDIEKSDRDITDSDNLNSNSLNSSSLDSHQLLLNSLHTEVHVWFCNPENIHHEAKVSAYKSVLSEQEMARYNRFHFEKDRHSYLVSHALLRHALSKYSTLDAAQWQFYCNDHGKPELLQNSGRVQYAGTSDVNLTETNVSAIKFNLTHTEGLCACVITLNNICGIDVENIHRQNNLTSVARRMFAEEELKVLSKAAEEKYHFYDFWTLREAYVKALGTGLAGSSKDYYFKVSEGCTVNTHERKVVLNFRNRQQVESNRWHFYLYEPTENHRLAVAYKSLEAKKTRYTEFVP